MLKQVVVFATACVLCASPTYAAPDWELVELRKNLKALSNTLIDDGVARSLPMANLLGDNLVALAPVVTKPIPAFDEPNEIAKFGWKDLRIGLGALAHAYGGKDNFDVLAAQDLDDPLALTVKSGIASLSQLRAHLTHRQLAFDVQSGAAILRVPIVIEPGATLRLGPDDLLALSRADGAYILNYGQLEAFGATIYGTEKAHHNNEEFRPFITTAGSGSVHFSGTTFKDLGFGGTEKFSGVSLVSYPTMLPTIPSILEQNRFDRVTSLAIVGVTRPEVTLNRFFDMRGNPLFISRSAHAVVSNNLFSGPAPTNAIRITKGSDNARIIGNVLLQGARAGVLVTSGSDNVRIEENLIYRRDGGGVKLQHTRCGYVAGNLILDDKQKGVEIRGSQAARIMDNKIIGNRNAGVWVSGQTSDAITYVTGNLLRENGSGIATAGGAGVAMHANDLSQQFPRLLDGDVTLQFRSFIQDLRGKNAVMLDAGGVWPTENLSPSTCDS